MLYLKFKLSNQKTLFVPRDNVIFHCISLDRTRTACAMEYILYFMATRVCPACCHKIYSMARVGSTNFKITKMAGYAKEMNRIDESDKEIQRVLQ